MSKNLRKTIFILGFPMIFLCLPLNLGADAPSALDGILLAQALPMIRWMEECESEWGRSGDECESEWGRRVDKSGGR